MIDSFSFGKMVVAQKTYNSDLIIYPDGRIQDSWWRENGHRMVVEDITELIASTPEVIVVGTGVYGYMKPDPAVSQILADKQIRLVAEPTKTAWQTYNRLTTRDRVGGCFHVGC